MKTTYVKSTLAVMAILTLLIGSACKKEKDKMLPPGLEWKTGAGYTYGDVTLTTNDTILVGITATKSEEKDPLTRFVATQKYDNGTAVTIINESFSLDTYSKDMTVITRGVSGTEEYTYTIINRDGITSTKKLNITVP